MNNKELICPKCKKELCFITENIFGELWNCPDCNLDITIRARRGR